jgi:hypothetical protein
MGGYAYVIRGTLDMGRSGAAAPPPSLLKRLLGTRGPMAPRMTTLGNGDRLFEVDPGPLRAALVEDFRGWLRARIPQPSKGTQQPLDYVMGIKPAIYVRGLQHHDEAAPEYNVQVSFSGCAGEAETSARVATHWAGHWYRAEHPRLAEQHLRPFGFTPAPYDPAAEESFVFLPAGDLGYLELIPPEESGEEAAALELDQSTAAAYEADPRLERLTQLFAHYVRDRRCRCQLCEPDFGDAVAS